jgi:hypothetical protein
VFQCTEGRHWISQALKRNRNVEVDATARIIRLENESANKMRNTENSSFQLYFNHKFSLPLSTIQIILDHTCVTRQEVNGSPGTSKLRASRLTRSFTCAQSESALAHGTDVSNDSEIMPS